ncbi:hypothetical protein [Sinomicrobium sp. M5D2P17]
MNKTPPFQLKRLSEIRHLLPDDTAAAQNHDYRQSSDFKDYRRRFAENVEEIIQTPGMDEADKDAIRNALEQHPPERTYDEWVLTLGFDRPEKGDWEMEDLDLDNIWETLSFNKPGDLPEGEPPFVYLIAVNGNLNTRNIYNRETDGATGLVVLGNLQADNIVAGGQEIYVTGDLNVKGLFWGDYNHGDLVVAGEIAVPVFISTDYNFDHKRFETGDRVRVAHWLWDEREDEFDREQLEALFRPECLEEDPEDELYSWKDWLLAEKIISRLASGLPVLLESPKGYPPPGKEVPFVFESHQFNNTNLQRLRESPLFLDHIHPQGAENRNQRLEYWRDGIFKRVLVVKEEPCSEVVYFQKEDKALVIHYEMYKPNLMERLKGLTDRHEIAIYCRTLIKDKETEWEGYDPALPAHRKFGEMTQPLWEDLLKEWSEMEYWHNQFRQTVSVEKMETILALPLVRDQYSDYYNDEADDFWLGNQGYQFRQPGNKENKCPRISTVRQLSYDEETGEGEFEFYHFDVKKMANGQVGVVLYTQKDNGYDSNIHSVPPDNIKDYREAIRCFEWLESRVFKRNDVYLSTKNDR